MSLFGPKKLTLDDILKGISTLSDEDKAKLMASLNPEEPKPTPEADSEEQEAPVEEAEQEDVKSDDAPNDAPDSVGTDEITEDAKEEAQEEEAEDKPEAEKDEEPEESTEINGDDNTLVFEATNARLTALEELVANLTERCNALTEAAEGGSFGGHHPEIPSGEIDAPNGMSPVMRSYSRKQTFR